MTFSEWLKKYFKEPKTKVMYERKDAQGEYDISELKKFYRRAYRRIKTKTGGREK